MHITKLALVVWLTVYCSHSQFNQDQVRTEKVTPVKLFGKSEADKILGAPSHLTDSVNKKDMSSSSYLCGYKADKEDPGTGKISAIYFLFEEYKDLAGAIKRFSDVYRFNRTHGMVKVNNIGDEAIYHTDNENFDLMMVRKGRYVFNIKINKRTSTSSITELKKIVNRITEKV